VPILNRPIRVKYHGYVWLTQIVTDVTETEETLPDGRIIVRKLIKTRQTQTIVKRIVMEGPEEGDDVNGLTSDERDLKVVVFFNSDIKHPACN